MTIIPIVCFMLPLESTEETGKPSYILKVDPPQDPSEDPPRNSANGKCTMLLFVPNAQLFLAASLHSAPLFAIYSVYYLCDGEVRRERSSFARIILHRMLSRL